mgnify:CR=1 FL=1
MVAVVVAVLIWTVLVTRLAIVTVIAIPTAVMAVEASAILVLCVGVRCVASRARHPAMNAVILIGVSLVMV